MQGSPGRRTGDEDSTSLGKYSLILKRRMERSSKKKAERKAEDRNWKEENSSDYSRGMAKPGIRPLERILREEREKGWRRRENRGTGLPPFFRKINALSFKKHQRKKKKAKKREQGESSWGTKERTVNTYLFKPQNHHDLSRQAPNKNDARTEEEKGGMGESKTRLKGVRDR